MKTLAKVVALILTIVCSIWLYVNPGFDSATALLAALATLIGLFVTDKILSPSFNQKVSGGSKGIQAGGNVSISNNEKMRD